MYCTIIRFWTAVEMGLRRINNGELFDRAEAEGFEPIVIVDKNLRRQQNVTERRIAILELWTNHRSTLDRHLARIRDKVQSATTGNTLWAKKTNCLAGS
jgi:hypothetical protein